MSAERPAKGLGMGLQALLGEAARARVSLICSRAETMAACAKSSLAYKAQRRAAA